MLEVWERKVLRRIYGGVKEGNAGLRRTNQEVEDFLTEPKITSLMRVQIIRWLGHIERAPEL